MRNWWLTASVLVTLIGGGSVHAVLPTAVAGERGIDQGVELLGARFGLCQRGPLRQADPDIGVVITWEGGTAPDRLRAWIASDSHRGAVFGLDPAQRRQLARCELPWPVADARLWLAAERGGASASAGFPLLS